MKQKSKLSNDRKQYVLQKYVIATSLKDALKKGANTPIEEVFINKDWKEPPKESKVGFK